MKFLASQIFAFAGVRRAAVRPEAALQWIADHDIKEDVRAENILEVKMEADCAVVNIDASIGKSWWDDSGISAQEFTDALDSIPSGKKIKVRINSEGGSVKDGLGIYDAIKSRAPDITACITGYAMSIASVIPLAASRVQSPDHAIWMIHKAWMTSTGNEDDKLNDAKMLCTHDKTMMALYAKKSGSPDAEWGDKMRAETWMTGKEAIECGLADDAGDDDVEARLTRPICAEYLQRCKNIPANIFNMISPAKAGASNRNQKQNPQIIMNRAQMLALLKTWGVEINDQWTDAEIVAMVGKGKPQAATTAAVVTAAVTAVTSAVTREEFAAMQAQLALAESNRVKSVVLQFVKDGIITNEQAEVVYIPAAVKDEAKTLALLAKMEPAYLDGAPISAMLDTGIHGGDECLNGGNGLTGLTGPRSEALINIHRDNKTPQARHQAIKSNYDTLLRQALAKDGRTGRREAFAGNTYSGTLVTNFLMDGAITDLVNVWAMLEAFSLASFCDPYKPLATGQMKHVTGSEAAQVATSPPASFEPATGSTVAPITVTMSWINQPMRVGAGDLNNGLRMEDLRTKAIASFADALTVLATAPITAANFTATPLIQAASAFGLSDLATLQGQLQKSPIKNLILDGTYKARVSNTPGYFQPSGTVGGGPGGWKPFGWDGIHLASNWTGAGNNIKGFACHPQAIVRATGLPLNPPNIPGGVFTTSTFEVPGCSVACAMSMWFSLATRTMFVSFDIIAGFAAGDLTAGVVVAQGTPS